MIALPSSTSKPSAFDPQARDGSIHIPSLDGLRAVSFFIVFAAHAGLDRIVPGGFGVTVFFFLSGYLITSLMGVEFAKTGRVSLRAFYLRRALRILPPFYIILVVATALGTFGILRADVRPQLAPVLSQLLHVSNYWITFRGWSGIATGTGVYWSLAVEEHFYLVFPALFLALNGLRLNGKNQAVVFWAMCAVVLIWRCVLVYGLRASVERTYLCSDTRIDSILYGCALAVWKNPILGSVAQSRSAGGLRRDLALVLGLGLLLISFVVRNAMFRETLRYTLQGIGLTPVFIVAVAAPQRAIFRPLNWRPLRFVGALSYSLYLLHQIALALVAQHSHLPRLAQAGVALAIAIAFAWAMYEIIEKPCARLRRRLSAAAGRGQGLLAEATVQETPAG